MKWYRLLAILGFGLLLLGSGCVVATQERGEWVPEGRGPWDGKLVMATSQDGLAFVGNEVLFAQAGVPNLLARPDGTLILTFQYFSFTDEELFDVIAYATSRDQGESWSEVQPVLLENLPEGSAPSRVPMDPTLVEDENGGLRLYFTYHAKGKRHAELYSAYAENGDIASGFVVESDPALSIDQRGLLDPAVALFDGLWHHYSWREDSAANYHSVSEDGITFLLQTDIALPMDFLGQVLKVDGGLRFYGTHEGNIVSAFSEDGYTWNMDAGRRGQGADPGVAQLPDGSFVMVYTSSK